MKFYKCKLRDQVINVISDINNKGCLPNVEIEDPDKDEVPIYTYSDDKYLKKVGTVKHPKDKTRYVKFSDSKKRSFDDMKVDNNGERRKNR